MTVENEKNNWLIQVFSCNACFGVRYCNLNYVECDTFRLEEIQADNLNFWNECDDGDFLDHHCYCCGDIMRLDLEWNYVLIRLETVLC